ncbi:major facilitator superfamily domain-containing protein [Xylariales sp. PMI_506]|nr:major facilitator superfamily domain-containing protein [Xylariales sp. PMI_506]
MASQTEKGQAPKTDDIATNPSAKAPSVHSGVHEGKVSEAVADIVHAAEGEYSAADYARVLRKIDMVLLPLMWIVSGTQYADKVSVSTQATMGLLTDDHLVGQEYSWLSSIFYIAFLVAETPGNYLLQRANIRLVVGISMFIWGLLVLCIAFTHTWAELMVIRTLQGIAECTTYPALLILTASWYSAEEHGFRVMVWATANAGMDVITSLINYGIGLRANAHPGGLAAWKGISLFLGLLTIILSPITYYVFGTPHEVRWLSKEDKRIAQARVVNSQTGSDATRHDEWKWEQVWATFRDPQIYFVFTFVLVNSIPNGGLTSFGNLVYTSFGFSALDAIVKGKIPQQLLSICWFIFAGIVTRRYKNLRMYFIGLSILPAFAGMLALGLLPKNSLLWTQWGVYFITYIGNLAGPSKLPAIILISLSVEFPTANNICAVAWSLVPSNIAGRTRKTMVSTALLVAYCAGNCIGAQVFRSKDAPRYIPAIVVCSIMYGVEFVLVVSWRLYYVWQNKRRDRMETEMGLSKEQAEHQGRIYAESDMTDIENIHFRYSM